MTIYPAIDIYKGKCVRLFKGRFEEIRTYSESPSVTARSCMKEGFTHLHVVDLEGARYGRQMNLGTIEKILEVDGNRMQVGGGIRTREDVDRLLSMGAEQVVLGSIAFQSKNLLTELLEETGEHITVSIDYKDGIVRQSGWLESTGQTPFEAFESLVESGVRRFISTNIHRDGTLAGTDMGFYRQIRQSHPGIELIASGGISTMRELTELEEAGIDGAIIGKAIYEGKLRLSELAGAGYC